MEKMFIYWTIGSSWGHISVLDKLKHGVCVCGGDLCERNSRSKEERERERERERETTYNKMCCIHVPQRYCFWALFSIFPTKLWYDRIFFAWLKTGWRRDENGMWTWWKRVHHITGGNASVSTALPRKHIIRQTRIVHKYIVIWGMHSFSHIIIILSLDREILVKYLNLEDVMCDIFIGFILLVLYFITLNIV